MTDCLFECLKEAHLDRYYPNFIQRGLHNCESLVTLSMPDYPRYGVVSMEDRLHLFKLIQIIKSIQGEGVPCQHNKQQSNGIRSQGIKLGSATNSVATALQGYRPKEVLVKQMPSGKNGLLSSNPAPSAPFQPSQQPRKEQNITKTSKPLGKPLFREKPLFQWNQPAKKSPEVLFRKGSDSPIFKCRKTLRFTDSECESSDDEAPQHNEEPVVSSQPIISATRETVPKVFGLPNSTTQQGSSVESSAPRAFFIDAKQHSSTVNKDIGFTSATNAVNTASPLKQAPIILSKEPSIPHAYFPPEDSSTEQKPVYVERVHHSGSYDYGVPTTPAGRTKSSGQTEVGKIQVCIRKRPLMTGEIKRKEMDIVQAEDASCVIVNEPKLAVDLTPFVQQHIFHFDQVFDHTCTNEDVYRTSVKPLVKCIFNRGTATCFAFGQTGAGKTYTLLGSKGVPGMYRLAGHDIFEVIRHQKTQNTGSRKFSLWISYFEIYCGQLFDLLNKRKSTLHVRENGKQKVCIGGLAETQVQDVKSLVEVIQYGNLSRSTGSTGINPHSSRSHAVLQMELRDYKDGRVGRLSFIDLAGSERASDVTEFDRQTRIEGAEINQSLLALKECIRSIDQDNKHTPYRQSKLTHILRESFVGNSQTVMIANVAPSQSCCENTLNTLRYADRVKELKKDGKSVVRGTPKIFKSSQQTSNRTPKRTPPSLFHPSKIPFSSTPKVKISPMNPDADLYEVLENADESPIQGHQIQKMKLQKKRRSHCVHQENDSNEGSYGQHPKISDVNNNSDKSDELLSNNNDKLQSAISKHSVPGILKSAVAAKKVVPEVKPGMCNSSVIVKETLSDTDISRYSIISSLHQDEKKLKKRSNSQGSVCFSEQEPIGSKQFTPRHNTSSDSSLSAQSDNELVEGHLAIINHLDRVLSKAKSVVKKMSPKASSQNTVSSPAEQTSLSSHDTSHGSMQGERHGIVVKRSLFRDPFSDGEHSSGPLSKDNSRHGFSNNVGSRDLSREIDGSMGLRLSSRDIFFHGSRDSSVERDNQTDFGQRVFIQVNDEQLSGDGDQGRGRYYLNSIQDAEHGKPSNSTHPSRSEHRPLPATTGKIDSTREPTHGHKWMSGSLRPEGKHLYYQHSMEPKVLFQNGKAGFLQDSSNVSGIRNIEKDAEENLQCFKDKLMWRDNLVTDVHAEDTKSVKMEPVVPLDTVIDHDMQRTEQALPLSARDCHISLKLDLKMSPSSRDSHVTQRTEPAMPLSARDVHDKQRIEPAMPLSARDSRVTHRIESPVSLTTRDNDVRQRTEPAVSLSARDVVRGTESALPLGSRDHHITQGTEPAVPLVTRDNRLTQGRKPALPHCSEDSHITQRTEPDHFEVRDPTSHRPHINEDHVTKYKHTDVADQRINYKSDGESRSIQCETDRDLLGNVRQQGEEIFKRTLSEAMSARKVLDSYLTENVDVWSARKYSKEQSETNHKADGMPFYAIQQTEMHTSMKNSHDDMKDSAEDSHSSEKRSWASILSQSNESHSLQSSQDSGISTFAASATIPKTFGRQVDEKNRSHLLIHADSAFTAISCTSQNKSRSHSTDSSVASSSCNLSRPAHSSSGEVMFMPIEPCSATSLDRHKIAMPVVVTKTVLSDGLHDVKEFVEAESGHNGIEEDEQSASKPHAPVIKIASSQRHDTAIADHKVNEWMHIRDECDKNQIMTDRDQTAPPAAVPDQLSLVHRMRNPAERTPNIPVETTRSQTVNSEHTSSGQSGHSQKAFNQNTHSHYAPSQTMVTSDNSQFVDVKKSNITTHSSEYHATNHYHHSSMPDSDNLGHNLQNNQEMDVRNQLVSNATQNQGASCHHDQDQSTHDDEELQGINNKRPSMSGLQQPSVEVDDDCRQQGISLCEDEQSKRLSDVSRATSESRSPCDANCTNSTQAMIMTTQNELIDEHEEQLSTIIALCKQEMRLLIDVKNGTSDFDGYLSVVKKIQNTKAQAVNGLLSKIDQYSRLVDK